MTPIQTTDPIENVSETRGTARQRTSHICSKRWVWFDLFQKFRKNPPADKFAERPDDFVVDRVVDPLGLLPAGNEFAVVHDPQVLRDIRLSGAEFCDQFTGCLLPLTQALDDGQTRCVAEDLEGGSDFFELGSIKFLSGSRQNILYPWVI